MSIRQQLINHIDANIDNFVKIISKQYNIPYTDLTKLWNGDNKSFISESIISTVTEVTPDKVIKATKAELMQLCKSKGLKCTGTKDVLIDRLLGRETTLTKPEPKKRQAPSKKKEEVEESDEEDNEEDMEEEEKPKKALAKNAKTTKKKTPVKSSILQKIQTQKSGVEIRRNKFGNFEHPQTSLVFNNEQKVIGKQEDDGTVSELTEDDIETCKKHKLSYEIPSNLDKNKASDVKIEELEESDIDINEDEEEIEEEEEEEDEDIVVEDD